MSKSKKATAPTTPTKKPVSKKMPIDEFLARQADKDAEDGGDDSDDVEGAGKIVTILRLWVRGYTRVEIVKAGFNRSTVYRQVGDFERLKKAPAMSYYGHELYEARLQRVMKAKKVSREKAVQIIADKDVAED